MADHSDKFETHEHDVLIIGAGGAGLRAAIEASAEGASVGLVCKSLLGKAHTVMAEGGVAAALANVDDRDGWKVHFADTMRGGQYLNNWRMAELHAKEAPARVHARWPARPQCRSGRRSSEDVQRCRVGSGLGAAVRPPWPHRSRPAGADARVCSQPRFARNRRHATTI